MGKSHPRGVKAPLRNDLSSHIEAHPYEELANGFDHIPSHSSMGNASKQSHSNSSGARTRDGEDNSKKYLDSKKSGDFIPKTPRNFISKDENDEGILSAKYRDRAAERRKQNNNASNATHESSSFDGPSSINTQSSLLNFDFNSQDSNQNPATENSTNHLVEYEQSKYLGGDFEHSHLVKGLDFLLLAKNRKLKSIENSSEFDAELENISTSAFASNHAEEKESDFQLKISNSLKKLSFKNKISSNLKNSRFDEFVANVAQNDLFLPLRFYYSFDSLDTIHNNTYGSSGLGIIGPFAIPNTVIRSQSDVKALHSSSNISSQANSSAFERLVLNKVASSFKSRKQSRSKSSTMPNNRKLTSTSTINDLNSCPIAKSSDTATTARPDPAIESDEDIFADAGRDYVAIPSKPDIKNINQPRPIQTFSYGPNLKTVASSNDVLDQKEELSNAEYGDVIGPYPMDFYSLNDVGENADEAIVSSNYPDMYYENTIDENNDFVTTDYPDMYNENQNSESEDAVTGYYPLESHDDSPPINDNSQANAPFNNYFPEDTKNSSNNHENESVKLKRHPLPEIPPDNLDQYSDGAESETFLDLNEIALSKNKGLTRLSVDDSLTGGYDDYMEDHSSGDDDFDEEEENSEQSGTNANAQSISHKINDSSKSQQMDVGSVSKFKKTQLTKFDFDSIEEWQQYKDNQVQLPKAAFQFGIKSKDSKLNSKNKSASKIRSINKRNHAISSAASKDSSSNAIESKKKAKLDRDWQATKNYMSDKYGGSYFD
ncbi:Protein Red [Smittium culicis]|uniref:Protein Red n=1 Tax=Smittium culicis TaxID=133412 RepID=A0A1R1WZI4_9FUNG|nr:Protein Red [Smittium culicis]